MRDPDLEWAQRRWAQAVDIAKQGLKRSPVVRVPLAEGQDAPHVVALLKSGGLDARPEFWAGGTLVEVTRRFTPKRSLPKSGRLMR